MSLGRSGISHAMKIDIDNIAFVGVQQEGKYKTDAWSLLLLHGDTRSDAQRASIPYDTDSRTRPNQCIQQTPPIPKPIITTILPVL